MRPMCLRFAAKYANITTVSARSSLLLGVWHGKLIPRIHMSTNKKKYRERLTNLERHALQRRRWLRDDPNEDQSAYTFDENESLLAKPPPDMVFGHISNNLRWAIYHAHKKDPIVNSVINLSNKHQLHRTRIEAIIQQKTWFLQDLARGREWGDIQQRESLLIDQALLESAEAEHEEAEAHSGKKINFNFKDVPIPSGEKFWAYRAVSDNEPTDEFEIWKKHKHVEEIKKVERRLGDAKRKRIEARERGAKILEETILKDAPKFQERRWDWVMKDTSLPGAPSVIRTRFGDLRLCTEEEENQRTWRNEKV